jgi:hypothetical protein
MLDKELLILKERARIFQKLQLGDFFKIAFFSKSIQKNLVHPENFTKHTILTSQKPF